MSFPSAQPVFRFAPSPNGRLHPGHAYSAILNFDAARRLGGRFLLRIEDIDRARCRPEFERGIYDDLEWLGLAWETPVLRQSEHFGRYGEALDSLRARGLAYPCFCSRADIARAAGPARDPDGAPLYSGACRGLSADERAARIAREEAHAFRLDSAAAAAGGLFWREAQSSGFSQCDNAAFDAALWGDAVIARKDAPASYHLCVVLDDALQGVTHVIRGRDLYHATALHRLLQHHLKLPQPRYFHHALILDAEQRKLSKSLRSQSLSELRSAGVTAAEIWTRLGFPF